MQIIFGSQGELRDYVVERSLSNIDTPEQCKEIIRAMLIKHGYDDIERLLETVAMEIRSQGLPVKGIHNNLKLVVDDEEGRMAHG